MIPKTNGENNSVTHGCIRLIHSYRFSSSSLDLLVKTLVDNKHKTLMNLKNENVGDDNISGTNRSQKKDILKIAKEIEKMIVRIDIVIILLKI